VTAATACARHIAVPACIVTARSNTTGRHGAQNPNGDIGCGTCDTTGSCRPEDHHRMPWSNSSRRSSKYGREHRAERARHMAALKRAGTGRCAERVCIKRSRTILPTDDLHLCHDPSGQHVIGLGHADCNRHEAAVRARALQTARRRRTPTPRRTTRRTTLTW
jgi:hypothetical protein